MAVAQATQPRLRPAPNTRRRRPPGVPPPLHTRGRATLAPSLPLDGRPGPSTPTAEDVAVASAPGDSAVLCNNAQVSPWGPLPHRPAAPKSRPQEPPLPPLVDRMLSSPSLETAEGSDPKQLLRVMDAFWSGLKEGKPAAAPQVVRRLRGQRLDAPPEVDVAVAGGTLGILLATALQLRGHRVAVVERRALAGREQEWNIGRGELGRLVQAGVLTQREVDACVVSSFGPVRVGFKGSAPLDCGPGILDCGVSPRLLIATLKSKFVAAGGLVLEHTAFKAAAVLDDGVALELLPGRLAAPAPQPGDVNRPAALAGGGGGPRRRALTARLLLDFMGHWSPVAKQLRGSRRPDGVVLVVGGAWAGFPPGRNAAADLLHTFTDCQDDQQLFWEAFPAAGGARTLYMFQYSDAHPSRPSFAAQLDTYFRLVPQYQGVPLEQLQPLRILTGGFPCYADAPLRPGWDRVLSLGDAGGGHSPLSFGGFGALVRHLPRLADAVADALREERLARRDLAWVQPYLPSLSAAFLLQRAMAPRPGQVAAAPPPPGLQQARPQEQQQGAEAGEARRGWLPADHVNRLLRCNFGVLRALGPAALRPFLQDTLRFAPLAATMAGMMLRDPICICRVLAQLGPGLLLSWAGHFAALAAYTLGHVLLRPLRPLAPRSWHLRRLLEALEYGSGCDAAPGHSADRGPQHCQQHRGGDVSGGGGGGGGGEPLGPPGAAAA